MAIFSDSAGFKYMGDCQWGTLDIAYPAQYYLEAFPNSSVSSELTALCTSSGLGFQGVATQAQMNAFSLNSTANTLTLIRFGGGTNRYLIYLRFTPLAWSGMQFLDDAGAALYSTTVDPGAFNVPMPSTPSSTISNIQWVGASDGNYLALCMFQTNFSTASSRLWFFYGGSFANVNTGFNYYSNSNLTNALTLASLPSTSVSSTVRGRHYIVGSPKDLLTSGDATYSIACSDGQTPTSQWATDFYAFDNNTTLGFPAIGRVRGMLLGIGTYTLGKPVKIIGSAFPDGGSPWYLPVGTFSGKVLLMKCYSSMS